MSSRGAVEGGPYIVSLTVVMENNRHPVTVHIPGTSVSHGSAFPSMKGMTIMYPLFLGIVSYTE